jgi:hypothetical protein
LQGSNPVFELGGWKKKSKGARSTKENRVCELQDALLAKCPVYLRREHLQGSNPVFELGGWKKKSKGAGSTRKRTVFTRFPIKVQEINTENC